MFKFVAILACFLWLTGCSTIPADDNRGASAAEKAPTGKTRRVCTSVENDNPGSSIRTRHVCRDVPASSANPASPEA